MTAERPWQQWLEKPQVTTPEMAVQFVTDLGFALLFPRSGLPSLSEVASNRNAGANRWGPDIQRIWSWKDGLPKSGSLWFGRYLFGQPTFLSTELLDELYPGAGQANDFATLELSSLAREVAEIILVNGPTATATLRQTTGMVGKLASRFGGAQTELGRSLMVTHYGTEQIGSGWPSVVLELTSRVFQVGGGGEAGRLASVRCYVAAMGGTKASELSRAFGWPIDDCKRVLEAISR